jgi:GNAT superfamily N-acetyltransferase
MELPFSLRRARPEDVFDVHRVHTTSIREGTRGHYDPDVAEVWVDAFNPESFPGNLEKMEFFVAELRDGTIAGFLALDLNTSELESVYVAPWGRGLGIGSFLLGFAEESARRAGLRELWLDSSLNAVGFYAGFGWEEREHHARVRRGVEIPVVKMEKKLGP